MEDNASNLSDKNYGSNEGMHLRKRGSSAPTVDDPEPTTYREMLKKWPKSTLCIISNEFCERFSYYGMRTVLTLYLINILKFNNDKATIMFHTFTVLAYTSPIFGSILADGYIGKFWTIFFVSLVYAAGQIILATASTFNKNSSIHPWLDFLGLFVIAMGTGGIKPCVSAFGGDQFKPHYVKMISIYFSIFYFMINAGSTISTFITPLFRALPCLGQDSCYPLAFGIPAALMITATVLFMIGSFAYKKYPPKENVIFRVAKTIKMALVNKHRKGAPKRPHWLDHCLDNHTCATNEKCMDAQRKPFYTSLCLESRFIDDVKSLIRVLIMMLPVPFFWSLYDQQGSRWVIQAVAMDAQITDNFALLPDQMATLNAILIMVFIPIFQFLIYPGVEKMGIRTYYLRRMVVGGILAALAFVISGFVQVGVNQTLPDIPKNDVAFVSLINSYGSDCNVAFNIPGVSQTILPKNTSLIDNKVEKVQTLLRLKPNTYLIQITSTGYCNQGAITLTANFEGGKSYYVAATPQGVFYDSTKWDKPTEGQGESSVRMTLLSPCNTIMNSTVRSWGCNNSSNELNSYYGRVALCRFDPSNIEHPCNPRDTSKYYYYAWKSEGDDFNRIPIYEYNGGGNMKINGTAYNFIDMKAGIYKAYYVNYLLGDNDRTPAKDEISVVEIPGSTFEVTGMGGVYSIIISKNGQVSSPSADSNVLNIYTIVPRNHLSILWQIPQYIIITAAEILFSITGLEFCYSQAAPSMKSVLQAVWCFTVALGDLIIIIIAELDMFPNLAIEMFAYAAGMLVVIFIFALMSIFYYEYVDYTVNEDELVFDLIPKELPLSPVSKYIDNGNVN